MKRTAKRLANLLARLAALPLAAIYGLLSLFVGRERAFPGGSQLVSLVPGLPGTYLRRAYYWWVLPKCGEDACISFGTVLSHPTSRIGRKVYIGSYCVLGDVSLEDDVLLGSAVSIMNGSRQHGTDRLDIPVREQPGEWPHVRVGRDTWIGDRAIVMADIGRHCVIGAGSVVTKPIPDYAVAVGNPARVLRFRKDVENDSASWDLIGSTEAGDMSADDRDVVYAGDDDAI